MGFFGFGGNKSTPTIDLSGVRSAIEGIEPFGAAFGRAEEIGGRISPLALGAREGALADLSRGTDFFEEFQPTSLEQALAQQSFQNIFPDVERSIKHNLSLSGIESSPILAQQVGRARGELGVDIGNILAQLGQRRAEQSLTSRLGIDPFGGILSPLAGADLAQSNFRQQNLVNLALQEAQADFQRRQQEAQQRSSGISSLSSLIGSGLGLAAAPFTGGLSLAGGAALGGALGGAASPLFGGGQSPFGLGDALSVIQAFPGSNFSLGKDAPKGAFMGTNRGQNLSFMPDFLARR